MKKITMRDVIVFAVALLAPQITQGQGTMTYLSNLGQASAGSLAVGSDSWLATRFFTGTNAGGYVLDSIQLGMADASGNPSGFTVMLYSSLIIAIRPGSSLGTLNGSLNPVTSGIYTYTPDSSLTLPAYTYYYIVLTAGTTVANGAYEWSYAGVNSYNRSGGWFSLGPVVTSSNGSSWNSISGAYPQFAINATPVPEPSPSFLLLLGSGIFIYVRRAFHR